jgi:hypothetical protein
MFQKAVSLATEKKKPQLLQQLPRLEQVEVWVCLVQLRQDHFHHNHLPHLLVLALRLYLALLLPLLLQHRRHLLSVRLPLQAAAVNHSCLAALKQPRQEQERFLLRVRVRQCLVALVAQALVAPCLVRSRQQLLVLVAALVETHSVGSEVAALLLRLLVRLRQVDFRRLEHHRLSSQLPISLQQQPPRLLRQRHLLLARQPVQPRLPVGCLHLVPQLQLLQLPQREVSLPLASSSLQGACLGGQEGLQGPCLGAWELLPTLD